METVTDFIFLGSTVTAEGDSSHETERHLLLGIKTMTNLDTLLKSFTFYFFFKERVLFPTKIHLVKAMIFPVVMYECDSWTIKNVEHRKIDAFELWC